MQLNRGNLLTHSSARSNWFQKCLSGTQVKFRCPGMIQIDPVSQTTKSQKHLSSGNVSNLDHRGL